MVSPPPHQNRSIIATQVTLTPPSGRRYQRIQAVRGKAHPSGVAAVCLKPLITPPPWRGKPHNSQPTIPTPWQHRHHGIHLRNHLSPPVGGSVPSFLLWRPPPHHR